MSTAADSDFVALDEFRLELPPGQSLELQFSITILNDSIMEYTEDFLVYLSLMTNEDKVVLGESYKAEIKINDTNGENEV